MGTSAIFGTTLSGLAVVPFVPVSGGAVGYYILVCDTSNFAIRKVTYPDGVVTTLAGSGSVGHTDGMGLGASFRNVYSIAVLPSSGSAPSGIVVVSDSSATALTSYLRVITPSGVVTTLAGAAASVADATGTSAAFSSLLHGVAVNPLTGALVVADSVNTRIRLVTLPAALPACDSTWHHVALTYSDGGAPYSLSAFVDGALVFASSPKIAIPSTTSTLRIGWSGDTSGGSLYTGSVSDLRIYTSALTAAQVATLAAS